MSKQKFIEAMGHVDDRILERYMKEEDRLASHKKKWQGLIVAAACLALVATVASFLVPPFYKTSPYSVQEIADLSSTSMKDGTNAYEEVTVPDSRYLKLYDLPTQNYLPIYNFNADAGKISESQFKQFINPINKRLAKIFNTDVPDYEIKEGTSDDWVGPFLNANNTEGNAYNMGARQTKYHHYFSFSAQLGSQLVLGGEPVQIDCRHDDEAILDSLSGIKESLFEIFNVSFTHAKVERSFSVYSGERIYIYFYSENAHPLNKTYADLANRTITEPVSDYIRISFQMNGIILRDATIEYRKARTNVHSQYQVTSRVKRLSLEEAEAHLYQGHVFGMPVCSRCMENQKEVDFENYDYVSFEYIFGRHSEYFNVPTIGIPYYVFYKQIGTDKQGNLIYAKTYVLAIHVDGLAEYFAAQHSKHSS